MQRPDFYTKVVLTVIAFCLVVLTARQLELIPEAQAAHEAPTSPEALLRHLNLNADGSLNVRIMNGEVLDVNLEQVDGRSLYSNQIPVDIRAVDGSSIFNNAVPVRVQ